MSPNPETEGAANGCLEMLVSGRERKGSVLDSSPGERREKGKGPCLYRLTFFPVYFGQSKLGGPVRPSAGWFVAEAGAV